LPPAVIPAISRGGGKPAPPQKRLGSQPMAIDSFLLKPPLNEGMRLILLKVDNYRL
jgi:hypothetical protein